MVVKSKVWFIIEGPRINHYMQVDWFSHFFISLPNTFVVNLSNSALKLKIVYLTLKECVPLGTRK